MSRGDRILCIGLGFTVRMVHLIQAVITWRQGAGIGGSGH